MSLLETCQIDHFLDNKWQLVGMHDSANDVMDSLQSPLFYVEDFMLVRCFNGMSMIYHGVYMDGEWVKFNENSISSKHPWSSIVRDNKSWLDRWRTYKNAISMMKAVSRLASQDSQYVALQQCLKMSYESGAITENTFNVLRRSRGPIVDLMTNLLAVDGANENEKFADIVRTSIPIRDIVRGLIR